MRSAVASCFGIDLKISQRACGDMNHTLCANHPQLLAQESECRISMIDQGRSVPLEADAGGRERERERALYHDVTLPPFKEVSPQGLALAPSSWGPREICTSFRKEQCSLSYSRSCPITNVLGIKAFHLNIRCFKSTKPSRRTELSSCLAV